MKIRPVYVAAFALAFSQLSFGDISTASNGSASTCSNLSTDMPGDTYTPFSCTLYNDAPTYTIDLTPLMTYGGASLYDNLVGPGYVVEINGDPTMLNDDSTGLLNESLWAAVLYWPADQDAGTASDALTVYFPGDFPSVSTVLDFDQNIYGPTDDSEFFIETTGDDTVYAPGSNSYETITPEPASPRFLLGVCLAIMAGVILNRRRRAQNRS